MSRESTRAFFDAYAEEFDAIYGTRRSAVNTVINRVFRKSMRRRFEETIEGCRPVAGCRVLDVGCGPGHYGVTLAREGAREVVGIDFAEAMIDRARRRAEAAGVASRCRFELGAFEEFEDEEPFDYVIVTGFMDYMATPAEVVEKAIGHARRRAFFSFPTAGGALAWQRRIRYRSRCDLYLYSGEEVDALFRGAGAPRSEIRDLGRDRFVIVDLPGALGGPGPGGRAEGRS